MREIEDVLMRKKIFSFPKNKMSAHNVLRFQAQARQSGLKAAILFKVALTNDSIFEN